MSLTFARTLISVAMLGIVALVGTACAPDGVSDAPTSTPTGASESDDTVSTEVAGLWGDDTQGMPHLEFANDGSVSGSDGCNRIVTTYTVEDGRIELAQYATTLKACIGVDTWLRGVRAAEVDGDVLVVMDAAGERLGDLPRAN